MWGGLSAHLSLALIAACGYPALPECFGTGLLNVCFTATPTMPLSITDATMIDTSNPAMCAATVSGADDDCVIAATTITIDATLRATGSRPLVLIASDSITVNQLIDVGSHRTNPEFVGAGADSPACTTGTPAGARGGGAGGSFSGRGGTGGKAANSGGESGGGSDGKAADGNATVTELRGGCPGQNGNGNGRGTGGHGGGAVYLVAGHRIDITGPRVDAAGEGGAPGKPEAGVSSGAGGGGSGGSGGMMGFDAPTIVCFRPEPDSRERRRRWRRQRRHDARQCRRGSEHNGSLGWGFRRREPRRERREWLLGRSSGSRWRRLRRDPGH